MQLEEYIKKNQELLPEKYGDIILPYRMVNLGEKISVRLICYKSENAALVITHNCFSEESYPESVALQLQPDGECFSTVIEIEFKIAGNTKLEFWCEGNKLVRQIAVLDKGYTAVIPWCGSNKPMLDEEIHRFDIPGDFWVSIPLFDNRHEENLKNLIPFVKNVHRYGDRLVCFVNGKEIDPESGKGNLFEIEPSKQEEGLKRICRIQQMLGIEKTELFASYTPGDFAIGAMEKMGVKGITSLCVWQNYMDGDWKINHQGASNQPYYPADDDFRRAGEKRNIMCFSMGSASCDRNYSIMAYDGCPSNVSPGQRYYGNRVVHHQVQRFYDAFDSFIAASRHNEELVTATVALESFCGNADWNAANEMAFRYVVKKASTEKIVFVSAADVADYHIRKGLQMQKGYFFQPDVYYGYHNGELPGCVADRIEADTPEYLAVIKRGSMRPMYFFDYTSSWENAEFEEEERNEFGLINPDAHDPSECSPKQAETRDVKFSHRYEENVLVITLYSETKKTRMVTGVFDVPYSPDFTCTLDKKDASVKKIYDTRGKNTHLFIDLGEIPAGETTVRITICGTSQEPEQYEYIFDGLGIMTFGDHAYLRSVDKDAAIEVTLSGCNNAYILRQDGKRIAAKDGILQFSVNRDWYDEAPILYGLQKEKMSSLDVTVHVVGKTACSRWSWDRE